MEQGIKEFTVGDCLDFINNLLVKDCITRESKMHIIIGQKIHPIVMDALPNSDRSKMFEFDKSITCELSIG